MAAPSGLVKLVERYESNRSSYRSGSYNETQVRREFIDPLFRLLNWDIENTGGAPEAYKEVVHEDRIKIGGGTKAPDYSFRVGGERKFFLEAKRPSVNLDDDPAPAFQLRRYAWTAKLPLSVLTDFEELAVYDCRFEPKKEDRASTARIHFLRYDEYPDRWDDIASVFGRDAVLDGSLEKYAESVKTQRGVATVDSAFLREIERWRELLAKDIALRNPSLTQRELNYAVQMTIDRIIFLRMAEDRGIEDYGRLMALQNGRDVYGRLRVFFREADERYNSGLFHFNQERDRSDLPDDLTPGLVIDDEPLLQILEGLYYPDSPYEFGVLPVEVLGQVYEQFLGKVIRLTPEHRAVVEEKPEVRKAGGVYYTPRYIVDYIVKHTLGKLLEGKRPGPRGGASKLRIVDPACGSGSFLIGAYEYLLNWHRDLYVKDGPEKHRKELYQGPGGQWLLSTQEKKRILLNNIYGVDIDPQAVEVTKLSLLLKVLEGETADSLYTQLSLFRERALPDLGENIKCGNSLIGPEFYDSEQMSFLDEEEQYRINVFDWKAAFPEVFSGDNPGFNAVIGNPPYIFTREQLSLPERRYFSSRYNASWEKHNTFMLFMELLLRLLRSDGKGGFIVPNSWLTIESAHLLRQLFVPKIELVADLTYAVFSKVSMEPSVFVVSGSDVTGPACAVRATNKETFLLSHPAKVEREQWNSSGRRIVFSSYGSPSCVVQRVEEQCDVLGQHFDVRTGLQAYERGKGKPPQTAEDVTNHVFDRSEWEDANSFRYLEGSDVGRFRLSWSGMWMQYGPWLSQPRDLDIFTKPRVLVREITSPYPRCLNATYIADTYLNNKSILAVLHPRDDADSLKCLVGVLNSRLISLYYKERGVKSNRNIFPKIVIRNLREFPLPEVIEPSQKTDLSRAVERMLELYRRLGEARTGQDRTVIQRQIEATDRQIDRLVYELYELTEQEILVVEASQDA